MDKGRVVTGSSNFSQSGLVVQPRIQCRAEEQGGLRICVGEIAESAGVMRKQPNKPTSQMESDETT